MLDHFGLRWDHIGVFLTHFGLCSVWFMQAFAKKHGKYQRTTASFGCVADVFDAIFLNIVSLLLLSNIRAMLGCVRVLLSPCWADVEPPWLRLLFGNMSD